MAHYAPTFYERLVMNFYDLMKNCGFSLKYKIIDPVSFLPVFVHKNENVFVRVAINGSSEDIRILSITIENEKDFFQITDLKEFKEFGCIEAKNDLCDESIRYIEEQLLLYKLTQ